MRVNVKAVKTACEELISSGIPYTKMDCQTAVEAALIKCGIPKRECDFAGSNAHYRKCLWTGTPEELTAKLGVSEVPTGFFMFIMKNDGGEIARGYNDGLGNASHIGIYLGNGRTFNSSSTVGKITASTVGKITASLKFNGKKSVRNGWNMCGYSRFISGILSDEQERNLLGDNLDALGVEVDAKTEDETPDTVVKRFTIKSGCVGGDVRYLQEKLGISVDGIFGNETFAAVMKFQQENALVVDGIVGPKTWEKLEGK